jgi:hypothetical protein
MIEETIRSERQIEVGWHADEMRIDHERRLALEMMIDHETTNVSGNEMKSCRGPVNRQMDTWNDKRAALGAGEWSQRFAPVRFGSSAGQQRTYPASFLRPG